MPKQLPPPEVWPILAPVMPLVPSGRPETVITHSSTSSLFQPWHEKDHQNNTPCWVKTQSSLSQCQVLVSELRSSFSNYDISRWLSMSCCKIPIVQTGCGCAALALVSFLKTERFTDRYWKPNVIFPPQLQGHPSTPVGRAYLSSTLLGQSTPLGNYIYTVRRCEQAWRPLGLPRRVSKPIRRLPSQRRQD